VTGTLALLEEFYRDKLAMLLQHQAGARLISQYDVNNTYQYIIAREEAQLAWIAAAIQELGGTLPQVAEPARRGERGPQETARRILEEDARAARDFVDRWRPRVEAMTHARHRGMLRVILGETVEHERFFKQALAGRTDLLGRRAEVIEPARGEVLPSRWIE